MYTKEQLEALPLLLRKEGERLERGCAKREALAEVKASLSSKRRILEGLKRAGSSVEKTLAEKALKELEFAESCLAKKEGDLLHSKAVNEIDQLNMEVFLKYLSAPETDLRVRVVLKAIEVDFEATVPYMKERLSSEKELHVCSALVKAIAWLSLGSELEFLSNYISHEDPRVRANTIEGLGHCSSEVKDSLFIAMLGDPHHRVALNASIALQEKDASLLAETLEELWQSKNVNARKAVVWASAKHLPWEVGKAHLAKALQDSHVDVRLKALESLPSLADPDLVDQLVSLLREARESKDSWYEALRETLFKWQACSDGEIRTLVEEAVSETLMLERGIAPKDEGKKSVSKVENEKASIAPAKSRLRAPKKNAQKDKKKRTLWTRLSGRVVEGVRKNPLSNVTIRLANSGSQELSDRNGRFCFERIEANKVHVFICEKTGWPNTSFRYRASGQRDQRVIIRMRSRGRVAERRK